MFCILIQYITSHSFVFVGLPHFRKKITEWEESGAQSALSWNWDKAWPELLRITKCRAASAFLEQIWEKSKGLSDQEVRQMWEQQMAKHSPLLDRMVTYRLRTSCLQDIDQSIFLPRFHKPKDEGGNAGSQLVLCFTRNWTGSHERIHKHLPEISPWFPELEKSVNVLQLLDKFNCHPEARTGGKVSLWSHELALVFSRPCCEYGERETEDEDYSGRLSVRGGQLRGGSL